MSLRRRRSITVVGLPLMLVLLSTWDPTPAAAQDAEVRSAVTATLAAWKEGDLAGFAAFFHPDARGYFMDGGELVEGVNLATLQAGYDSGVRAELDLSDLTVQMYGDAAVSAATLTGTLTLPGGLMIPGSWRYTETRVRVGSEWQVIQFHFSPLSSGGR